MSALSLLSPSIHRAEVPDGWILSSTTPLPESAETVLDWLDARAAEVPDRTFLAERTADGSWSRKSYAEVADVVPRIAGDLRLRGAGPKAPVMVLADNSVNHAIVAFAAMHAGAPVAPISTAYVAPGSTFDRLRRVASKLGAAVVYAPEAAHARPALAAIGMHGHDVLCDLDLEHAVRWPQADRAPLTRDTVAKILFTSGSTGDPKGVVNTHGMLTANQESLRTCWPFLADTPPVVVDWLPWSHTFGGNHNLNLVLRNAGTLYVDRGRPAPGLVETTLRNLAAVGPNLWFNVPRGFDQAVDVLERDPELARGVFRNLRLVFYAAAALAPTTRARLEAVAMRAGGGAAHRLFFTSAWGSTETSPLATTAHFPTTAPGVLGVPVPGVSLKLARVDGRLELRVRGPNVTPGYWGPGGEVEPAALDADGFLPMGDAGAWVDEHDPARGVVFAGRIGENFKLSSGTWVSVGALRLSIVDACAPLVSDAVIAGHDRDHLGVLLVPSPAAIAGLSAADLEAKLREALNAHGVAHPGSSERVRRALVLRAPLSLDEGETTDKGYTNQRRVLEHRANEVARLFAETPDADVWAL